MNRFIYSSQHFYAVNIVTMLENIMKMRYIKRVHLDFHGNTVLKALCFHCKRHRLDTAAKKKKKYILKVTELVRYLFSSLKPNLSHIKI